MESIHAGPYVFEIFRSFERIFQLLKKNKIVHNKVMKIIIMSLLTATLISSTAFSCFHFPKNYVGALTEGRKEIVLFHDGKNAHMVIRTTLTSNKFPKEIAWVLPFPSLPSKYEEIDGPFFEELNRILPDNNLGEGSFGEGRVALYKSSGIKVHDAVVLGHYVIQPIEILKEGSGKELNAWLQKNKFTGMPYDNQKYYLRKGAAFLAIRMKMNRPASNTITSKPLHIVYVADKLTAPIKFTHDKRTFSLDLYIFSKKELKKDLTEQYLKPEPSARYKNEGNYPFVDSLIGQMDGYLTRYKADSLNTEGRSLMKLKEDPSFLVSEL